MDSSRPIHDWIVDIGMTLLTLVGGGVMYQKKKDDDNLRDALESNRKEHLQLWDKKADKEFQDHIIEEIKISREERREDMREIRATLAAMREKK